MSTPLPPFNPAGGGGGGGRPTGSEIQQAEGIIEDLTQFIVQLVNALNNYIATIIQGFITNFNSWLQSIVQWLNQLFQSMVQTLANIVGQIKDFMTGLLNELRTFFTNLWEQVRDATIAVLEGIYQWIEDAIATLQAFVGEIVDTVIDAVQSAIGAVVDLVEGSLGVVGELANTIASEIVSWVDTIEQAAIALLTDVTQTIQATYEAILAGAAAILSTLQERLVSLRDAFLKGLEGLVAKLADIDVETFGPIRDSVVGLVDGLLGGLDAEALGELAKSVAEITAPNTLILNDRRDAEAFFNRMMPSNSIGKWLWMTAFGIMTVMTVYQGIGQANAQRVLQEYGRRAPWSVLPPADAAAAWRRGFLSYEDAVDAIQSAGYTRADAQRITQLSSNVPAVGDLLSMLHRGIIPKALFEDAVKQQGFDGPWPDAIREAGNVLPPVADVITMAVRDVFSEEAVAQGRLFDDFPAEVGKWTEAQGLSREWALRYWGAHWTLPSVQMAYEMLHRGVIDQEQLNLLLKAQDIAPGWREPLVAISYSPYTRVDIRRMHAMGILSDEEVKRAYKDLGYDEAKAENLKEFTIRLNRGGQADDELELGKLTRTTILGFYSDGILPREKAFALLTGLGITVDAANLFLDSEDFDRLRQERNTQVGLIIEQAEAGTITFEKAADNLRELNLSTLEVERALTQLLRAQQRRVKLPTRAEGEKMFRDNLITERDYSDLLSRLGYPQRWVTVFINQARKG